MRAMDENKVCNPFCNSPSCVFSMGACQPSSNCLRSKQTTDSQFCFICPNTTLQIYDYCTTGSSCPSGFEVVDELTPTFLGTNVCLRSVGVNNTINNFFEIYVHGHGETVTNRTFDYETNSI